MKLEYIKIIHKEDGKPDRLRFTITYPKDSNVIQPCCKESEMVMGLGFFEIAYDNRNKYDRDWDKRQLPAEKPEICLHTMECGGCDDSDERLYPIPKCPFCGKDNEIVLTKVKEVKHIVSKKIIPEQEIDVNTTQEKILFDSTDNTSTTEAKKE